MTSTRLPTPQTPPPGTRRWTRQPQPVTRSADFQSILPGFVERYRAGRAAQAEAEAQAAIVAAEIKSYRDRLITETGLTPGNLGHRMRGWDEQCMTEVQVRDRLKLNLEKRLEKIRAA